ncbi:UPF0489 family protein [Candidatus Peregrinibacteria bacterium]|nr:MAG: UPF0489 family protein [Candidatus Peregrinibacteria bacterium]
MKKDYSEAFWIEGAVGNNALSFERRGAAPKLWVPALVQGTIEDVKPGKHLVFEDFDEHEVLQSCVGLEHLVKLKLGGVPAVVVDNHNHVFYFWAEAAAQGILKPGASLIHIDQHRDMRVPQKLYEGTGLEDAFDYVNFHLNVGNYIVPAQKARLVDEIQFVTSEEALKDLRLAEQGNKILNIDLDYFAPELDYIDFELARRFLEAHLPSTSLITVATSPFFIEQERAIEVLRKLF